MKFQNKIKIPILLISIGVIAQAGIAFSSWLIISNKELVIDSINGSVGETSVGISGVELNVKKKLNVGRYFYYVDGESVENAELSYSFNITPSLLPKDLVLETENGGYSFKLIGNLYLDNISIFDEGDAYLSSAKFNNFEISSLGYNGKELIFDLEFETATQNDIEEEFILSFTFNNKLILDFRSDILSEPFKLEVTR